MQMDGDTLLITGGASGIGYALSKHFLTLNDEVIMCGRRESRLFQKIYS